MTHDLTIRKDLPAAVLSLCQVPAPDVTFLEIRRDKATYPRLTAVPRDVAVTALQQIIFRATFTATPSQFKADDQDQRIALMADELYDLCLEDYYNLGTGRLSFAELARVIRAGSAGRDFYGVSVRTLYSAVLDYCEGEGHKAGKALQREIWDKHTPEPPEIPATPEQRHAVAAALDNLTRKHQTNKI